MRRTVCTALFGLLLFPACREAPAPPTPPRRTPLLTASEPATISGETRPATPIPPTGLRIHLPPSPAGSAVRFAVGVRPVAPKGRQMVIAHDTVKQAPQKPVPARPRPGPQIKGRYEIVVKAGAEVRHTISPGAAAWIEGRLDLPQGAQALEVSVRALAPGPEAEVAFLGDPTLETPNPDPRRGAIVISIDSLRADHLGSFGYDRPVSPILDRLSRSAEVYTGVHTTACWTLPAHVSMLASRYGSEVGAVDPLSTPDRSTPALAEVFRSAGYVTWARVNHMLVSERFGFDRGFSVFRKVQGGTAASSVDEALAFLDRHPGDPFFLFLHFFDVHYDYTPPAPWNRLTEDAYGGALTGHMKDLLPYFKGQPLPPADLDHVVALYDGEIGLTDREIGRLLRGLSGRGLAGGTLLAVTADHGEEFQEHGSLGHGLTLYDEQLRVPLLVHGAGAGLRTAPASLLDLAPTVTHELGLPAPADWRGRPLPRGADPGRVLLSENRLFTQDITAAVRGTRKVVADFKAGPPAATQLDLDADPRELAPAHAAPGGDLVPEAVWLRQAFRPGVHILSPAVPAAGIDALLGHDPETGMWQLWLGDEGNGPAPVAPADVRARLRDAARAGHPARLRVQAGNASAPTSAEDLETLKQLGYVQ